MPSSSHEHHWSLGSRRSVLLVLQLGTAFRQILGPQPAPQSSKRNLKQFDILNFTRCDLISFVFLTILSNCVLVSGLVSSCCKLILSASTSIVVTRPTAILYKWCNTELLWMCIEFQHLRCQVVVIKGLAYLLTYFIAVVIAAVDSKL